MAYYNKIGLLVFNEAKTKFLVCEKAPENVTSDFIMPGGQLTEATHEECLKNEIKEELSCEIDESSLKLIGEYEDAAAGRPDRTVSITLYSGLLVGEPRPSSEIKSLHWIGASDQTNSRVSPIIRNKIIPDLIAKNILL